MGTKAMRNNTEGTTLDLLTLSPSSEQAILRPSDGRKISDCPSIRARSPTRIQLHRCREDLNPLRQKDGDRGTRKSHRCQSMLEEHSSPMYTVSLILMLQYRNTLTKDRKTTGISLISGPKIRRYLAFERLWRSTLHFAKEKVSRFCSRSKKLCTYPWERSRPE